MWNLPGPGLETVSPALAGGFLTIAPPGKSQNHYVFVFVFLNLFIYFYFWLCWIFVAVHGLSPVAASQATLCCSDRLLFVVASLVVQHGL